MNPALHFHENINIYLCVKSCADILALKITVKVNSLYTLYFNAKREIGASYFGQMPPV